MKSELKTHTLQSLADAFTNHDLRINHEYQRGEKWKLPQKQGLIDSLLRGYQIPLFYIHLASRTNSLTSTVETTAWLVDGQQRLATITSYMRNEFALPSQEQDVLGAATSNWSGKKFNELGDDDRERLLDTKLVVSEMIEEEQNEARDLFIRLQAGTPLTAQEKRDAWPGDFTLFVIRHAGKDGHKESNPHLFFKLVPRSRELTVDDGEHYVDRRTDTRKFFAGLAMTIMVRERYEKDFVDLTGKTINNFYKENLELSDGDPGKKRVLRALDTVTGLSNFHVLLNDKPMSFSMALHLVLLVDSLLSENYVQTWQENVVTAFRKFKGDIAAARLHYKNTGESTPHYDRFARLLSGSGSDTAELSRSRHAFFLAKVFPELNIQLRDASRRFGPLEKEVIWNRDRWECKKPGCLNPKIQFRDAEIHHIIEHNNGGATIMENGILICRDCHRDRPEMQRLTGYFQDYVRKITVDPIEHGNIQETNIDRGTGGGRGRLRVQINWRELFVDRDEQTIKTPTSGSTVVRLLEELIREFGESIKQQLTQHPVIRFPLSAEPEATFVYRGRKLTSIKVEGTNLYFCPHSSDEDKVKQLGKLFAKLELPDGLTFPEGSVIVSKD